MGEKKPNGYSLYDMAGNVWEWTASNHGNSGMFKILRGGSYYSDPSFMHPAYRYNYELGSRNFGIGFRCAR